MTNDVKARLQSPAIALILVGAINIITGLLVLLNRVVNLGKGPARQVLENPDRLLGYQAWVVTSTLCAVITIIVSPLIIYGAAQMLGARKLAARPGRSKAAGMAFYAGPQPCWLIKLRMRWMRLSGSGWVERNSGGREPPLDCMRCQNGMACFTS